jgi:hypothetical protein
MQRYLAMFFGGDPELKYQHVAKASPEKREAHLRAWKQWTEKLANKGALEAGCPLDVKGTLVSAAGSEEHTFPDESAGGFLILKAESLDEAAAMLKDAPIIKNGGRIEVRLCGATG